MNAKPLKTLISLSVMLTLLSSTCTHGTLDEADESQAIEQPVQRRLAYMGEHDVELVRSEKGTSVPDTVYYTIPKFSFVNQDGKETSHRDYEGKVFVADFFFTTCKSICPMMSSQMARLQGLAKKEGLDQELMFLSHSVKPENDTPEVLKEYGNALGADYTNWNFVTGKTEDIYDLAQQGYMLTAFPSDTADGGVFHTDKFTLIDRQMHIRGYYDGTSTSSVDQLLEDIKILLKEEDADLR